jgi:polyhydroxybutyrate depolymerase
VTGPAATWAPAPVAARILPTRRTTAGTGEQLAHGPQLVGRERTFRLYRPAGLPASAPVPLVVMLHGAAGSGGQAESAYHWNAQADRHRFVVAYPDGLGRAWAVSDGCCGAPARDGVDDVAFIERVVAAVSADLPVDPARVFAAGISNGGMLAYRLACDTTLFAVIGPVAATQLVPCPEAAPLSVIHVHGTADRSIPYAGGPGRRGNDGRGRVPARIDGPAVPALAATWRGIAGCAPPTATISGPVTTALAACPHGRAVQLVTVAGAGHQWPGGDPAKPAAQRLLDLDPPSAALDATATVWRFFAAHPKPAAG